MDGLSLPPAVVVVEGGKQCGALFAAAIINTALIINVGMKDGAPLRWRRQTQLQPQSIPPLLYWSSIALPLITWTKDNLSITKMHTPREAIHDDRLHGGVGGLRWQAHFYNSEN